MGKSEWRESSTGPDLLDVMSMAKAIGVLHSARVELVFSPLGIGFDTGASIRVVATFELLPGSSLPRTVEAEDTWPSKDAKTPWGAVYNLLWQLDYRISQVYKNEELWK